jgi:hypothetical protein
VIESIDESQTLVKVLLGGRDVRGDAFVVRTEVRVEGDRLSIAGRRRGSHRRFCAPAGTATGEQSSDGERDDVDGLHAVPLSYAWHFKLNNASPSLRGTLQQMGLICPVPVAQW